MRTWKPPRARRAPRPWRSRVAGQVVATGGESVLGWAMAGRLQQPYRRRLVAGYADVEAAAAPAGRAAVALSGAGPSLVAFAADGHEAIARAMQAAFEQH